ncbi:MAG TPA: two-component regulator propeller domain-containing protein, partial [Rhodothermales bacterium]|nr:two-component regulator propeller domain-containing protein [Rhodothermales bacterium]
MTSPRRSVLIALFVALALATQLLAQRTEVEFQRIRVPGGFLPNRIMAIVQDDDGFMWISTAGGLFKYDGFDFTEFDFHRFGIGRTQGYPLVWGIAVDRSGALWICPDERGLHRLDPRTDEVISFRYDPDDPRSLSSDDTRWLFVDRNDNIWVSTSEGALNRLDVKTQTFTRFPHDPADTGSLPSNGAWQIYEDLAGVLWVATTGGLARFNPVSETFTRFEADPDDETTLIDLESTTLLEDRRGRFWVGTYGDGLHTMDREHGTFRRFPYDPNHPNRLSKPHLLGHPEATGKVEFMHEDRSGIVWIGAHSGGINLFDPDVDTVRHYEVSRTDPNGLANNLVYSIGESRDGVVWIGTMARAGEGLHRATRVNPLRFQVIDAFITGYVHSIHESAGGMLWMGTETGLYVLDNASGTAGHFSSTAPVTLPGPRNDNAVLAIEESADGNLWIGGYRAGFARFDPARGTFDLFHPDPPRRWFMHDVTVTSIRWESKRSLWIGTLMSGLVHLDPEMGKFTYYQNDPDDPRSLSSNRVSVGGIHRSADGALWIATQNGLNRFDPEIKQFDRYLTGRPERRMIRSVVEGRDKEIWVGWLDGSLARLDTETGAVEDIDGRDAGLPGREIVNMLGDAAGNLWVMTDRAIARYDVSHKRFYSLPMSRDVAGTGLGYGALRSKDGRLFFGARNGFYSFDPEQMIAAESRIPPQGALTGLNISGRKVEPGDDSPLRRPIAVAGEIRLAHNQRDFSLGLAALHYVAPQENRIVYMLEGYDDDWRDAGTDRRAGYFKVPAGTYTFRVRAANPFGVWSTDEASIRVVVLPPWWRSWWAYIVYAIVFSLVLYTGYEVRVRRLRKHASALTEMVRVRTKELRAEKATTEEQARHLVELNEAKDRFFSNISHEFRTPLTLILGPLEDELSGIHGEVDPKRRRSLLMMQRAARRLHRLISQLLDLSKLEVGRMKLEARRHDLVSFVRLVALSFAPMAERRAIALTFRSEIEKLPLFFDADKLEHVIINLFSNAFKFTSENGKILVAVDEVTEDGKPYAEVSVQDTGMGIPASEIPFIFDRFHQADFSRTRIRGGTGIGLALAKEMVELHHGRITVRSQEGFGTTFVIRLPKGREHFGPNELADDAAGATRAKRLPVEPSWIAEIPTPETAPSGDGAEMSAGRPTILIVDDNGDVREYLKGHLDEQYLVIEAADGIEGLQ